MMLHCVRTTACLNLWHSLSPYAKPNKFQRVGEVAFSMASCAPADKISFE